MEQDPDAHPTPEQDYALFEAYDEFADDGLDDEDVQAEAPEWQPGECDMCAGPPRSMAEQQAVLASAIVPACACWMGRGAAPGNCYCGPELFEGNKGEA